MKTKKEELSGGLATYFHNDLKVETVKFKFETHFNQVFKIQLSNE